MEKAEREHRMEITKFKKDEDAKVKELQFKIENVGKII